MIARAIAALLPNGRCRRAVAKARPRQVAGRVSSIEGTPCLVITKAPAGSTAEQIKLAHEAVQAVFAAAGYDLAAVGMGDTDDAFEEKPLANLWMEAEQAATLACWAPRSGPPEPTEFDIYFE